MSTQIFEYVTPKLFNHFPVSDAFLLIDNRILALSLFALGLLIYYFMYRKNKVRVSSSAAFMIGDSLAERRLGWLGSILLALGAFSYSYGLTDEVFVNLVHPLNLITHGIFSFDPYTKIDGTVEPLFYLLHVLGGTKQGIIIFNFIFSFVLFIATAYLVNEFFIDSPHRVLIRNLYLLFPPIVFAVSGGFGAVFINYLFLQGLLGIKLSNRKLFYSALVLLALSRPESMAYDAVLIVLGFIYERKLFLPLLTALGSVAIFYLFYRYYYGHWIPTPLYFKAYPSGCPLYLWSLWKRGLGWFVNIVYDSSRPFSPFFIKHHVFIIFYLFEHIWYVMVHAAILVAIIALCRVFKQMVTSTILDKKYIFSLALLFLLPILVIYTVPPGSLGGSTRYYLVLTSLVYLTLISSIDRIKSFNVDTTLSATLAKSFFMLLAFFSIYLYFSAKIQLVYNRNMDANVGSFFKDMPAEMTVSTSELNTLGYFSERSIIDLWGYTNTQISRANMYIADYGRRINPYFFLQVMPVIGYNTASTSKIDWSPSRHFSEKYGDDFEYNYSLFHVFKRAPKARRDDTKGFTFPTEPGWLLDNLAMPIYYGDPKKLYEKYDVVFIHDQKTMFAFLLRKDHTSTFQAWVKQKGVELKSVKKTDYVPALKFPDVVKITTQPPCQCFL